MPSLAGQGRRGQILRRFAKIFGRGGEIEEIIFADLLRSPAGSSSFSASRLYDPRDRRVHPGSNRCAASFFPDWPHPPAGCGKISASASPRSLPELLVALRTAGEADDREIVRQQPVLGQVIKRGNDLAVGQVARGAEDDRRDLGLKFGVDSSMGGRIGSGHR